MCIRDRDWHEGVIGIIASRIKQKFNKPCIVFSSKNGIAKGSGRSVKGIDLGNLIIAATHQLRFADDKINIGDTNSTLGSQAIAIGLDSDATGAQAIGIGYNPQATGEQSISIGYNPTASGARSAAIGYNVTASGTGTFVVGTSGSHSDANTFVASNLNLKVTGTGQSSFAGQVTIPATPSANTDAASKGYVDTQITAQDLDFAGGSGTGSVDLDSQTFTIAGTSNEIETSASGQTLTAVSYTHLTLPTKRIV